MWSTAREVAAGDTVIVWLTRDQIQPLVITPGKDFNTKFGNFKQDDFIGVPYGSKVPSKSGRGFIHLLRPTPELWTLALPHRTQILYLADIAFITSHLNITPGSTVIEAGTGSASFSHSVVRTIGATGRLYSYEFHEARFLKARDEFARHAMFPVVALQHRNVCKDGFTIVDAADSVFLDLPAPWDAVEHAKKALRKDRPARICCFSPCIEQVLRTVNALNEAGFTEITTYETLLRPLEVFQTPPLPPVGPLAARLKHAEVRREEKRQRQIAANRAQAAAARGEAGGEGEGEDGLHGGMEVEVEADGEVGGEEKEKEKAGVKRKAGTPDAGAGAEVHKRAKTAADEAHTHASAVSTAASTTAETAPAASPAETAPPRENPAQADASPPERAPRVNVSKALAEVRGHTSYLTFACLAPVPGGIAAAAASADVEADSAPSTAPAE